MSENRPQTFIFIHSDIFSFRGHSRNRKHDSPIWNLSSSHRHLIKNNSEVRPKCQEKSAGGETQLSLLGRHPCHDTLFRGEPFLR